MSKFYISAIGVFSLLFFLQAPFNYAVDPYCIFGERRIFKEIKEQEFGRRVTVPFNSMNLSGEGVVVGSSRALSMSGWDYFADKNVQWNNLWINMANVDEISRVLRQAVAYSGVRIAIVGLDFEGFNAGRIKTGVFNEMYYAQNQDGSYNYAHIIGLMDVLLSFETTQCSIASLIQWYTPSWMRGVFSDSTPMKVVRDRSDIDSDRLGTMRKICENFSFEDLSRGVSTFRSLELMLKVCYDKKINLFLFINPEHALTLEAYRSVGAWTSYQEWFRKAAAIVDDFNRSHPGSDMKLWSFAGYNSINSSVLDRDELANKYFVDEAHFSSLVGRFIMDRFTGKRLAAEAIPEDFGVLLTRANVESYIETMEAQRQRYLEGLSQ
jgi:hypothetical protein